VPLFQKTPRACAVSFKGDTQARWTLLSAGFFMPDQYIKVEKKKAKPIGQGANPQTKKSPAGC